MGWVVVFDYKKKIFVGSFRDLEGDCILKMRWLCVVDFGLLEFVGILFLGFLCVGWLEFEVLFCGRV